MHENAPCPLAVHEVGPHRDTFLEEVLAGLQQPQKALPPKFFYDAEGSRLFDAICDLDEYYVTRTELAIMQTQVDAIVAKIPAETLLLEYGSGSSLKTRLLLDHLPHLAGYVPIDISRDHLLQAAETLVTRYPHLNVFPIWADYSEQVTLPPQAAKGAQVVVYFPGSTLGNFTPQEALAFLKRMAKVAGEGGGLLIGIDLKKDPRVLNAAYNDAQGVTAAFNKNVLARINRELGGSFNLNQFQHYAFYNPTQGRVEMHLISKVAQAVEVAGTPFHFAAHETLLTEYSHKYSLPQFAALAAEAGFAVEQVWTDPRQYFSVQFLRVR